jgi:hypothetical protein
MTAESERKRLAIAYLGYGRSNLTTWTVLRSTPVRSLLGPALFAMASVYGFLLGLPCLGWLALGLLGGILLAWFSQAKRVARSWPLIASFLAWPEVERAADE